MSHSADPLKSIFFALGANLSIAVAKVTAAIITGSGSMVAEAIHSFADSGNQLLLLLGIKHSKKPPTPDYPLGFGKAVYFWSFIVAIILFSMGGLYSIYEGIHKLQNPAPIRYPLVAIGVLLFSIIAEGASLWGCLREINKERKGRGLWQWFRESRRSDLLVVFGEDIAALFGLIFALVAVTITILTGNVIFDAVGSIGIGILLVIIAVLIGIEIQSLLIGQSVEPLIKAEMLSFFQNREEINYVFNMLTFQLGNDVMVAVKAKMINPGSSKALVQAINRCENDFKKEFPEVLWLFFEPDIKD